MNSNLISVSRWTRILIVLLAVSLTSVVCFALVMTSDRGDWPDSWPKELEFLRDRAETVEVGTGIRETVYEIPFESREEFEKAWPYILKLKSRGAPIILEKSPSNDFSKSVMRAGVRVLWPSNGIAELPDGTRLQARGPWPESIKSGAGELPEYVITGHGTWVAFTGGEPRRFLYRARVDIVLVADGRIVDLNRIELPGGTPIIDKRFNR